MTRELPDLLSTAVPTDVATPDLARIQARVTRRRAGRVAGSALAVIAALGIVLPNLPGDEVNAPVITPPSEAPSGPAPSELSEPDDTTRPDVPEPTEPAVDDLGGAAIDLDAAPMPVLGEYGIAVDGPTGVRFLGLDGEVLATMEGVGLVDGDRATGAAGALLVGRGYADGGRIVVEEWATTGWLDPAHGTTLPGALVPTTAGTVVLTTVDEDRPVGVFLNDVGDEVTFDRTLPWTVSADHRSLSWTECDGDACIARTVDGDMGGDALDEDGCLATAQFADFNAVAVCNTPDGSWLRIHEVTNPEPVRVDAPTGTLGAAAYALDGFAVELRTGCELPQLTTFTPDGRVTSVFGGPWQEAPHGRVLGTVPTSGSRLTAVQVADSDACPSFAVEPGIWLLRDGGPIRIADAGVGSAQLWTPSVDLLAARDAFLATGARRWDSAFDHDTGESRPLAEDEMLVELLSMDGDTVTVLEYTSSFSVYGQTLHLDGDASPFFREGMEGTTPIGDAELTLTVARDATLRILGDDYDLVDVGRDELPARIEETERYAVVRVVDGTITWLREQGYT